MENSNTIFSQIHNKIFVIQKYFTSQFHHSNTFNLLRISLFCFLLSDTLIALPVASQLWGPSAYIKSNDFSIFNIVFSSLNLLSIFGINHLLYIAFIFGKIFFLILGIFNIAPLLSTVCVYFFLLNLDNKAWVVMNGGNNIVHVVFIYLILMHLGQNPDKTRNQQNKTLSNAFREFGNVMANFAFFSARIQIALVYFVAGLTKLQSHLWRDGVALYYVLSTREFSHPWAQKFFLSSDLFIMLGTYGTLLFQLSFPWLVWNRHFKRYFLLFGTFIHLQIAFVMGLFDFGITVSIMYLIFLNEAESIMLKNRVLPTDVITVGFDHNCKLCMQFAKFLKFFDFKNQLTVDSAQSPQHTMLQSVTVNSRMDKIASFRSSDGKVFSGFETIYEILRRIPFLIPLRFILWIMKFKIGSYIYRIISQNLRKKTGCYNGADGSCSLKK